MKKIIHNLTFLFLATGAFAQDFQEISTGAGYQKQSFIQLANGSEAQVNNDAWDIAFSTGSFAVGVFVNESAGSSMGAPLPATEIYLTSSTDFSAVPDPAVDTLQLFNPESDWGTGALNTAADPNNPLDMGWGTYDPTTHAVNGGRVFLIKLRSGQYRKLQVQSLIGTAYTFRYANLDGTGETTKTIDKANHPGRTLAYFSFATGAAVDVEPSGSFDLLYCRYITPLFDPGTSTYIPYTVTGILSGDGVEVAQANGVDPANVSFDAWEDSLSATLDVIGYDWKTFTGTAWSLPTDRAYFVKTANGNLWKIVFVDFEGSATGTATFEKTNLGPLNAVGDEDAPLATFDVFPNPASVEANIVFTAKSADAKAVLTLRDLNGRAVFEQRTQVDQGLNGLTVPVSGLPTGAYFLTLDVDNQLFAKKVQVVR